MMFMDRADAGRQLAAALLHLKGEQPVVLALPRGGVPVASEVARILQAPLDLMLVRKIGAPGHEEYGIGAVADGAQPVVWIDHEAAALVGASDAWIDRQTARELSEIERRRTLWLGGRPPVAVEQATAILVDDGIATGGTMRAALRSLRRRAPRRVVMAVPVAPPDTLADLEAEADETVCLFAPPLFHAVGMFYEDFHQLTDDEVAGLLEEAGSFAAGP